MINRNQKSLPALVVDMPYSVIAEGSVLGSLMLNNDCWNDVSVIIKASDFWLSVHRYTFEAMAGLVASGRPIDLITLSEELERQGNIDQVGGFAGLAEMSKRTPSAANVLHYAEVVAEKSRLRALLQTVGTIVADVQSPGAESARILDALETRMFALAEQWHKGVKDEDLLAVLDRMVARLENDIGSEGLTGTPSGYRELDQYTCGLQDGDLVLLAARPSMGKTALATGICTGALEGTSKPVFIFTIEMKPEQLALRMTSALGRIPLESLRSAQLNNEDWARFSGAMGKITSEWKGRLIFDGSSQMTPAILRARARRYVRQHGKPALIMMDYLQLMRSPGEENRTQEIAQISRSLKALAKELDCPVLALSQLNRSVESRADKRPNNGDLRDSGALEQDADLIMMLYRDEVYNASSPDAGTAEIIITKQRQGQTGTVKVRFDGRFTLFEDFPEGHHGLSDGGYRA
ncbi:replicative DNA helicase [Klebsiella aerogenes]